MNYSNINFDEWYCFENDGSGGLWEEFLKLFFYYGWK